MSANKYCVKCRLEFCDSPNAKTAWKFLKASFDARGHVRQADLDLVDSYLSTRL